MQVDLQRGVRARLLDRSTSVREAAVELVGKFILKNGKWSTIRQSQLSAEDAKLLEYWTPPPSGASSVFDDYLWGKLVRLQGEELKAAKVSRKPAKYYVFYYTASWCGPCRKFTPTLVDWYNENKNGNFELFLISSDRNEPAMVNYAKSKKMPWPHVAYDQIKAFKSKFRGEHGVRGIPMLIVCTPDGKVLGYRKLHHPHENEQPFTRSLSGVEIPDEVAFFIGQRIR